MSLRVFKCSSPRRSIISVPEAVLPQSQPQPVSLVNLSMTSGGKPSGNTGNGFSSTMPAISQWPVAVSLPGEAADRARKVVQRVASGVSVLFRVRHLSRAEPVEDNDYRPRKTHLRSNAPFKVVAPGRDHPSEGEECR